MKRTAVLLLALLTSQMVWTLEARAEPDALKLAPPAAGPTTLPPLVVVNPRLELSRPRLGARRELMAGLWASAASASFIVLGGIVMGAGDRYGAFSAGLALTMTGGTFVYPIVLTLLYGAGHNSALRELDGAGSDAIDRVEVRARRIERTGIGLFGGGLGLMLVGVGMLIGGLVGARFGEGGQDHSNPTLFWSGFSVAMVGDATAFAGTLVWTYGGGVHRGVRQADRSMHASLGGVGGTF